MQLLIYILIGISLSVDAFSLALAIGVSNNNKKLIVYQPVIVGVFHYIMPIIGSCISSIFINKLLNNANIIISIVFMILAIEIYRSKGNQKIILINSLITLVFISLTVSLDSLLVGLALSLQDNNIFLVGLIFAFTSAFFSALGLYLGQRIRYKYHNLATYIGISILLVLALKYLIS